MDLRLKLINLLQVWKSILKKLTLSKSYLKNERLHKKILKGFESSSASEANFQMIDGQETIVFSFFNQ